MWLVLALIVFTLPLVYVIATNNKVKRERQHKLEAIQQRLAEIEQKTASKRTDVDD